MRQQSSRRMRGVILTLKGWDKLQAAKSEIENHTGNRFTLEELSVRTHLALHTMSKILARSEPVDKSSLQKTFSAFGLELCKSDYTGSRPSFDDLEARKASQMYDWGEVPDTSIFYGRFKEMSQLRRWVLEERCRLLALLGIGGIGKSTLAVKLGLQIQDEFDVVVWRSLQHGPSVQDELISVLQFLLSALRKEMVIPESFDGKRLKLMECLRNNRCLLY